jgi:hypothetical protein
VRVLHTIPQAAEALGCSERQIRLEELLQPAQSIAGGSGTSAAALGLAAISAASYLEESLARFPTASVQEAVVRSAGFSQARHRPMAGGLMGLLELQA